MYQTGKNTPAGAFDVDDVPEPALRLAEVHAPEIAARLARVERLLGEVANGLLNASLFDDERDTVRPVVVFAPCDEGNPANGFEALPPAESLSAAVEAIAQIEYKPGDAVNRSVRCHGVLGVSTVISARAHTVNAAKQALREAVKPLANRRVRVPSVDEDGRRVTVTRELTTVALRMMGRSHYNLLAAYRALPVIDHAVERVRLMLTRTRSVPRRTAGQLLEQLAGASVGKRRADLEALAAYVADDPRRRHEYLVCPKAYYWRMRAQVSFSDPGDAGARRRSVVAELPLLVPRARGRSQPTVLAPLPPSDDRRHPPPQMEPAPFLPSIGFHRMRAGFRVHCAPTGRSGRG